MDFLQPYRPVQIDKHTLVSLKAAHQKFLDHLEAAASAFIEVQDICSSNSVDPQQLAVITGVDDVFARLLTTGESLESAIALNWLHNHSDE